MTPNSVSEIGHSTELNDHRTDMHLPGLPLQLIAPDHTEADALGLHDVEGLQGLDLRLDVVRLGLQEVGEVVVGPHRRRDAGPSRSGDGVVMKRRGHGSGRERELLVLHHAMGREVDVDDLLHVDVDDWDEVLRRHRCQKGLDQDQVR